MKPFLQRVYIFPLILLVLSCCVLGEPRESSPTKRNLSHEPKKDLGTPSKWSSYLTIDPSKLLLNLIQHGGLLMPKEVQDELFHTARVCHVDKAELNVVERRLVFHNFTVRVEDKDRRKNALRVGRMSVSWDSYTKPCIEIQVEDVDILVDFTNILLTRNNWNELKEAGFPPKLSERYSASSSSSSTFIRIGSIDLKGGVSLVLHSRPLDRDICPPVTLSFAALEDLFTQVKTQSSHVENGRRGVTTLELYRIVQDFFTSKLKAIVTSSAYDLVVGQLKDEDTDTMREAKRMLEGASSTLLSYANDAGKKASKDIHSSVVERLEKMGFTDAQKRVANLHSMGISLTQKLKENNPEIVENPMGTFGGLLKSVFQQDQKGSEEEPTSSKETLIDESSPQPVDLGDIIFPDFP